MLAVWSGLYFRRCYNGYVRESSFRVNAGDKSGDPPRKFY